MTDTQGQNSEKLRAFYQGYNATKGANRGDFLALCADSVTMGSLGGATPGAEFLSDSKSKAEVAAYLDDLFSTWDMNSYVLRDVIAQGDGVVAVADISFTFKQTGKHVKCRKADIFKFQDGVIVEFYEYFDTAAFRDAMT